MLVFFWQVIGRNFNVDIRPIKIINLYYAVQSIFLDNPIYSELTLYIFISLVILFWKTGFTDFNVVIPDTRITIGWETWIEVKGRNKGKTWYTLLAETALCKNSLGFAHHETPFCILCSIVCWCSVVFI